MKLWTFSLNQLFLFSVLGGFLLLGVILVGVLIKMEVAVKKCVKVYKMRTSIDVEMEQGKEYTEILDILIMNFLVSIASFDVFSLNKLPK